MPVDAQLLQELCQRTLERTDLRGLGRREEGKVRDSYVGEKRRTIVVTDRVSCFDVVVGTIPAKGQVLNQLAAFWFEKTRAIAPNHLISVPDPKTLLIQPWDASQMAAIEKAILKSDLGLTPSNDGKAIRLTLPALTEERRKQLARTVGKLAEDARVAIRNIRRDANDRLKALAKDKKVSQDEERRGHDQIQKTTDRFVARVEELTKKKEQEILSI